MNAYKKYLHSAETKHELSKRIGLLTAPFKGGLLGYGMQVLDNLHESVIDMDTNLAAITISTIYKEKQKAPNYNLRKDERRTLVRRRKRIRHMNVENFDFWLEDGVEGIGGSESEELMPIIHGGEIGRIHSFLYKGRGYRTDNNMPNYAIREFSEEGIMVHSIGRFNDNGMYYYATSRADAKCSIPAYLIGWIPRKYMYHNQGDEYSIPAWHFKEVTNYEIITQEQDAFWDIQNYYKNFKEEN